METDQRLIQQILRHGSRAAADALVRRYYDELFRFVYRQTGNREDALDLTQECFIAILHALPTYKAERAGFRTWAYRVAVNKVIDARRRKRLNTVPFELDLEDIPAADDFAARVSDADLLQKIEEYVRALDPALQQIYRLRIYGGAPFTEIAAALGEPEAKIKAQYYRLMQRIRKEFSHDRQL